MIIHVSSGENTFMSWKMDAPFSEAKPSCNQWKYSLHCTNANIYYLFYNNIHLEPCNFATLCGASTIMTVWGRFVTLSKSECEHLVDLWLTSIIHVHLIKRLIWKSSQPLSGTLHWLPHFRWSVMVSLVPLYTLHMSAWNRLSAPWSWCWCQMVDHGSQPMVNQPGLESK